MLVDRTIHYNSGGRGSGVMIYTKNKKNLVVQRRFLKKKTIIIKKAVDATVKVWNDPGEP